MTKPSYNDPADRVLTLRRLPGILRPEEVAVLLNIDSDDLRVLTRKNLLRPLGRCGDHDRPRYSAVVVQSHMQDPAWMERMSREIYASRRTPTRQTTSGERR